jgi:RNA polymerase sigma-70 factor, ECF subfamily
MSYRFENYWLKIQKGDENSLKALFTELSQELCSYAYQLTSDRFLSEEVVQDIFIKIWQNRENITFTQSIKAYLYQSVHNTCINILIQKKTKRNSVNVFLSDTSWEIIQESAKINSSFLEKIEAEDTEKLIDQIIQSLPTQCKQVFLLSRFENKSNQEIAATLKISENTVKTHIFRALDKIREALKKNSLK